MKQFSTFFLNSLLLSEMTCRNPVEALLNTCLLCCHLTLLSCVLLGCIIQLYVAYCYRCSSVCVSVGHRLRALQKRPNRSTCRLCCGLESVADPGFLQGGAAAGAFGVPQAPSCPHSLRPLRKFRGSYSCKVKIGNNNNRAVCCPHCFRNW